MNKISNEIIRWKSLKSIIGVSRSTIDRWEKIGKFPRRLYLGENIIGWSRNDVEQWLNKKVNESIKDKK